MAGFGKLLSTVGAYVSPKRGSEQYVWRGQHSLLVVDVNFVIKVIQMAQILFGWEVPATGQASVHHLTFARGRLYIV